MTTKTKTTADELLAEVLQDKPSKEGSEKEDIDLNRMTRRAPPSRGLCRRCGQNKPINRLMLCYPCWVKTNLEEHGWREGMPHPEWCQCEGVGGHPERRSAGN
ncbi:MAG: hypothetical protein WC728_13900 [Elusimicrobiota bacterium]